MYGGRAEIHIGSVGKPRERDVLEDLGVEAG